MKLIVPSSAAVVSLLLLSAAASETAVGGESAAAAAAAAVTGGVSGGEEDDIQRRRHLRSNAGAGERSAPDHPARLLKRGRAKKSEEYAGTTGEDIEGRAGGGKKDKKKARSGRKKGSKKGRKKGTTEVKNFADDAATSTTATSTTVSPSTAAASTSVVETTLDTETPGLKPDPDPLTFLSDVPCEADEECKPHSWYCDRTYGGCHCSALHIHDMFPPGCEAGTEGCHCVNCFVDPCMYKTAVCDPDIDVCRLVNVAEPVGPDEGPDEEPMCKSDTDCVAFEQPCGFGEGACECHALHQFKSKPGCGEGEDGCVCDASCVEPCEGYEAKCDSLEEVCALVKPPPDDRIPKDILMDDLAENMAKWNDLGLRDYDFFLVMPFAAALIPGMLFIKVRDGVLSSVSSDDGGGGELTEVPSGVPTTVPDLFGIIDSFIQSEPMPDSIVVSYEDEFGFLMDILVDPDEEVEGDEVEFIVERFTPRYDYSDLRNNENMWDEEGLENYDMVTSQMCQGCGDSGPFLVEVRNGVLDDWSYIDGALQKASPETLRTVAELFDFIRSVLDNGGHNGVRYNEEWGYPEEIYETSFVVYKIRSREVGAEEEAEVEMCGPKGTNLENECEWTQYCCNPSCGMCVPLGSMCIMLACLPEDDGGINALEAQSRLDENMARWDNSGLNDYDFTFRRSCFCVPEWVGPFRIEVRGGSVAAVDGVPLMPVTVPGELPADVTLKAAVAVSPPERSPSENDARPIGQPEILLLPPPEDAAGDGRYDDLIVDGSTIIPDEVEPPYVIPPERLDIPTVLDMFDAIQQAINDDVYKLEVAYDDMYGFPTKVFIDRHEMMADEERGFSITDFVPVVVSPDEMLPEDDEPEGECQSEGDCEGHLVTCGRGPLCGCVPRSANQGHRSCEPGFPVARCIRNSCVDYDAVCDSGRCELRWKT